MSDIDHQIENVTALCNSLGGAATSFVNALVAMKSEALALEQELAEKRASVQREIELLNGELAQKREEHRSLERSLRVLRAEMAKEREKLDQALAEMRGKAA